MGGGSTQGSTVSRPGYSEFRSVYKAAGGLKELAASGQVPGDIRQRAQELMGSIQREIRDPLNKLRLENLEQEANDLWRTDHQWSAIEKFVEAANLAKALKDPARELKNRREAISGITVVLDKGAMTQEMKELMDKLRLLLQRAEQLFLLKEQDSRQKALEDVKSAFELLKEERPTLGSVIEGYTSFETVWKLASALGDTELAKQIALKAAEKLSQFLEKDKIEAAKGHAAYNEFILNVALWWKRSGNREEAQKALRFAATELLRERSTTATRGMAWENGGSELAQLARGSGIKLSKHSGWKAIDEAITQLAQDAPK